MSHIVKIALAMIEYEFSHLGIDLNTFEKGSFLECFDKDITTKSNHFFKNLHHI